MFDAIAPTYDRLNRMISLGLDGGWRRRVIDLALMDHPAVLLDIGTGTGDLVALARRRGTENLLALGIDFSHAMLLAGRSRVLSAGGQLARADALRFAGGRRRGRCDRLRIRGSQPGRPSIRVRRMAPRPGHRRTVGDPGNDANGQWAAGPTVQVLFRAHQSAARSPGQRSSIRLQLSAGLGGALSRPRGPGRRTGGRRIRRHRMGAPRVGERCNSHRGRTGVKDLRINLRAVDSPRVWNQLFGPATGHSFLQRWEWGEIKRRNGWRPIRIGAFNGTTLVAGMQVLVQRHRPLRFLPAIGIAYVPRGPVGRVDGGIAEALVAAAVDGARLSGASLLRVEPAAASAGWVCPALLEMGFGVSDQHVQIPHSAYIDLGNSESKILAGFKSKTRYNTRLATRRGVEVRRGGEQDLASFFNLTVETGLRDGFAIHDQEYYEAVYRAFGPDDSALFLAAHEGSDLAALMAIKTGWEAVYVYGASTSRERRRMPSYAVQWEAMRWARDHGCRRYDLWGMADPENDRDPMLGVSRFKNGYNPVPIEHPGTFDLDLSRPLSGLIKAFLPMYQQVIANRSQPEPASN